MRFAIHLSLALVTLLSFSDSLSAQSLDTESPPETIVIHPQEVVADVIIHGQRLIVQGRVKGGVLVLGGDAVITGQVEGDVAAMGGSIIQHNGGFIGGNVIVLGGRYEQSAQATPRRPEATTVVITEYGEELRDVFQHPWRSIFIPRVTAFYLGQRILGLLFYFLLSLLLIALIPTQLMRAIETLKTRYLSISLIGLVGLLLTGWLLMLLVQKLPIELSASILLFAIVIMLGVYLFGSLVIHLAVGRWLQQRLGWGSSRSNINALLYAMALFAIAFSIPVIGLLVWFGMAILSFGISLSAPFSSHRHAQPVELP